MGYYCGHCGMFFGMDKDALFKHVSECLWAMSHTFCLLSNNGRHNQ